MNERLSGKESEEKFDLSKWDILRDHEKMISEYWDQAVQETEEEYRDKTPFEKKVMFGLIINEKTKKEVLKKARIMEEDNAWDFFRPSKERIKNEFEYDFNFGMNCGGFALEIFACVFPESKNIDDATENILRQFAFVRILEEGDLDEDEYVVVYRNNGKGDHHFIKVDGGKILEKNEAKPVQEFVDWPESLEDAPSVTFAVSKNHEIEPRDQDGDRIYSYFV